MDEDIYKAKHFLIRLILLPQCKIWQAINYVTKYLVISVSFLFKKYFSQQIF